MLPPERVEVAAFTVFLPFNMSIWLSLKSGESMGAPLAVAPVKLTMEKSANFEVTQLPPLQTDGASTIHSADEFAAAAAVDSVIEKAGPPRVRFWMVRVKEEPEPVTLACMVSPAATGSLAAGTVTVVWG